MTKAIIWSPNYSNAFLGHGSIIDMRLFLFFHAITLFEIEINSSTIASD